MKTYLNTALVVVLVSCVAASFFAGRALGVASVKADWQEARAAQAEADRSQVVGALDESRRLAAEARVEQQEALERAVRASEERQAARLAQTVRGAVLEASTRKGAYVAPECVLEPDDYELLQEQLGVNP